RMFTEIASSELTNQRAGILLTMCLSQAARLVLPIAAAGFAAGVLGSVVQFGFLFTWAPLTPDVNRINPLSGFQRVASTQSLVEGFKSLIKLIAVVSVTYMLLKTEMLGSSSMSDMESGAFMAYMTSTAFRLVGGVCVGLFVVAALDFAYQKYRYRQGLMMTKQEVKQEHKQREGDPLLKARIRSLQREMARKRMMQDVPKADVIVTNPTHIAVALKYDAEKMAAPRVIAKGADLVAQRIKEVARKNGIPIVENVPLARALHKSVKVGKTVPRSLYQAVAEVLAYVYRLKGKFNL
ncbi:MAG: EscU/YscU/HrcU family type III secretion system export apparatus switch protein, partial [Bdellovibrionota bacterium]